MIKNQNQNTMKRESIELKQGYVLKRIKLSELESKNEQIKVFQSKVSKLTSDIYKSEIIVKDLQIKVDSLKNSKIDQLNKEPKEKKDNLRKKSKKIKDLRKKNDSKDKLINLRIGETQDLKERVVEAEEMDPESELEFLKNKEKEQKQEIDSMRSSLAESEALNEEFESEANLLNERFKNLVKDNERLEDRFVKVMRKTRSKEDGEKVKL